MRGTISLKFSWERFQEPCLYVDMMLIPSGSKSIRANIGGGLMTVSAPALFERRWRKAREDRSG